MHILKSTPISNIGQVILKILYSVLRVFIGGTKIHTHIRSVQSKDECIKEYYTPSTLSLNKTNARKEATSESFTSVNNSPCCEAPRLIDRYKNPPTQLAPLLAYMPGTPLLQSPLPLLRLNPVDQSVANW